MKETPFGYAGQQVVSLKAGQWIKAHIAGTEMGIEGDWKQNFRSEADLYNHLSENPDLTLLGWEWEDHYEFIPFETYQEWVRLGREG